MKNPNYADSFDDWQQSLLKLKTSQVSQARIHTGFHRFTEIGQVFHNKYIFNNSCRTFQVEIWKMVWTNVFFFQFTGIRQKPGKGNFRELKPKKNSRGCIRAPLEACSLGPSFRKSVSIYPRSASVSVALNKLLKVKVQSQSVESNPPPWLGVEIICVHIGAGMLPYP